MGISMFLPDWLSNRNDYKGLAVKNLKPIPVEQMGILKTVSCSSFDSCCWLYGSLTIFGMNPIHDILYTYNIFIVYNLYNLSTE